MAGAFEEAQVASDAAKAAALSALARGGSGALAEHKAAQDQIAALRQQSATSALQRAASINAGAAGAELAAGGSLAGTSEAASGRSSASIYDRYSQDQGRAATARQQALADMAGANNQYFSQVNAARPIIEGRAKAAWDGKEAARVLAEQRAAQAQADREQSAAWRQEDRGFKLEDRALSRADRAEDQAFKREDRAAKKASDAAKAAAKAAGKPLTDTQLSARLIGAARFSQAELAEKKAALPTGRKATAGTVRMTDQLNADRANMPTTDLARRIGVGAGIDPARAFGVVKNDFTPAQLAAQTAKTPKQAAHRTDVTTRVQKFASPNTYDTFLDVVVGRPKAVGADGVETAAIPPAQTMAAAMSKVNSLTPAQLKAVGVSKDSLVRWLTDYYKV